MPPAKKPHRTPAAPAKNGARQKTAVPKAAPPVRIPKRPTPEDRIPRVIENPTLDDHLAVITRAVMQAGMSWAFIESRWDDYVVAFENFAVAKVAAYDDIQVDRLMNTDGIIHSKSKIEGTIKNARALIDIEAEFGSLRAYHESFATYDDARKDAKKRFAFMGDLNTYYWRFRTGATVPNLEEWLKNQERDHPRMREMVTLARG